MQRARDEGLATAAGRCRSYWIGNPITRQAGGHASGRRWMLCGHSHKAFAVTLGGDGHGP